MDTPYTPDIVVPAATFAYLTESAPIAPIPDEVIRNDKDDPRFYIYDFAKLAVLSEATDKALQSAEEDIQITRLTTFKNILSGMRTAIRETDQES